LETLEELRNGLAFSDHHAPHQPERHSRATRKGLAWGWSLSLSGRRIHHCWCNRRRILSSSWQTQSSICMALALRHPGRYAFVAAIGPSQLFERGRSAINYLVPLPAFLFFRESQFLSRGLTRIAYGVSALLLCLFISTFLFGSLPTFYILNSVTMIAALVVFIAQSVRMGPDDADFVLIRRGLVVYLAFVLCAHVAGLLRFTLRLEPYGFAILLGALGYVAARRTLHREEQFDEIEKELEIAKRIQMSILPASFPPSTHFQTSARYLPMTSVAGDFYEFLVADDLRAGLLIADVSGHGVPAALISSMVKLAATSQRDHAADPAKLLSTMNAMLCGNTQTQFVTAAYVYLDAALGELRYSAAGHPPMLLLREGEVTAIEENGLLLAAFPFAAYTTSIQPLKSGDRLLLYTDGIIEANNGEKGEFGQDNLCTLLRQTAELSVSETADHIISAVQSWSESQEDDLTVLVCDYHSKERPATQFA
jgi:sigma-B regulation protein RsbU (phosphoserine phosphatase)